MIDKNTPIAWLTVEQFLELQKLESKKPKPPSTELPKYLNPTQLADLIGWKIQTVYQNHHNGMIPGAKKLGGRLLFDSNTILDWIEENSIKTKKQKVEETEQHLLRRDKSKKA